MGVTSRLEQRQAQVLTLTPQLRQAIKLLELTNLEIQAYVEQAVMENPLLTLDHPEAPDSPGQEVPQPDSDPNQDSEQSALEGNLQDLDHPDYENEWADLPHRDGRHLGADDSLSALDLASDERHTLRDHLMAQVEVDIEEPVDRLIASHLIDHLDDAGYLRTPLEEIASTLKVDLTRLSNIVKRLKQFDPAGIFAENLAECLRLQLMDKGVHTPKFDLLLQHLDLFAEGKIERLLKLCHMGAEDLAQAMATLRHLDPKPGLKFDSNPAETLIPDVLVRKSPQTGDWTIELNQAALPRVLIDEVYRAQLTQQGGKTTQRYLSQQMGEAQWLIKALDQRAQNILKVATEIMKRQRTFLEEGVAALIPLTLKDVALAVEVHESTVSRVTANKYIATPRGVFELKFFFSSSLGNYAQTGDHAAQAVRHRIKALIQGESLGNPLSDDDLVELLAREGVNIARRTVAKYREALGIPSSYDRKRAFKRQSCL
ncbi:MAG: RNA polymerase factor sigma-54 [Holosporales bacterium]